jgi:WD40 repeat protein
VRLLEWPSGTLVREWAIPNGPFHVFLLERAVAAIDRDATLHYLPVDGAPVAHPLPFRVNGYYPAPLAFFPERALLAGATTEPGFAVYDLAALPAAPRLVTRTSFVPNVTALAFSPAAARLAIATDDHRLAIWDWEHELPLLTFPLNSTCASVAFSPDGQWLANTDYAPSLVLRRAALSAASK